MNELVDNMTATDGKMERELIKDATDITGLVDRDLKGLANFLKEELEYSKDRDDKELFLLTRLIWKAKSLTSEISQDQKKIINEITLKYEYKSDTRLLIAILALKYMIKCLDKNASELGLENEKEILSNLEERAYKQYEEFKKDEW